MTARNSFSPQVSGDPEKSVPRVATDLERVDLAGWQADAARWRGRRAVVLAGAFADTVAVSGWTPDSLAGRFPDVEVTAYCASRLEPETMTLARLAALLRTDRACFMVQQELGLTPGLFEELDVVRAADPPYVSVNLFIGNRNRSPMHFDVAENVFVQVHGTKRFIVEPPTGPARRYMHEGEYSHFSRVDPQAPDLEQFPDYDPGHQRVAVLSPGDALYIPPGWLHDVTALDTSISVNCWFGDQIPPHAQHAP